MRLIHSAGAETASSPRAHGRVSAPEAEAACSPVEQDRDAAAGERLVVGKRSYRIDLMQVPRYGLVRICEAASGAAIPECRDRRSILRALGPAPRPPTIFLDHAHRQRLWAWEEEEGVAGYHERLEAGGLLPLDDPIPIPKPVSGPPVDPLRESGPVPKWLTGEIHNRLLDRILTRLPRLRVVLTEAGAEESVRRLIWDSEAPEDVRAVWNAVLSMKVLDPDAGTGDWLLAVSRVLAPVYTGCLQRMQGWLNDLQIARARSRPEKLADFRILLQRAKGPTPSAEFSTFVRLLLLRYNLYGAFDRMAALEACLGRLWSTAATHSGEAARPKLGLLDHHLTHGLIQGGLWSRAELADALAWGAAPEASLERVLEELEVIGMALQTIRSLHPEVGCEPALAVAADEVARRRAALGQELDACIALSAGTPAASQDRPGRCGIRTVHPFVDFHSAVTSGGFDLVRIVDGDRR